MGHDDCAFLFSHRIARHCAGAGWLRQTKRRPARPAASSARVPPPFPPLLSPVRGVAGGGWSKKTAAQPAPPHPLPASPLVAQGEPGQPGGRLGIAASASPRTFNPLFSADGASAGIIRLLFSSLVNMDQATQEPGPGLAESWSLAPDQKTWTFKLRPGEDRK